MKTTHASDPIGMRILSFLFAAHLALLASAQLPYFNVGGNNLWVEGYDPVAYLVQGKAMKGSERITTTYRGATFRFANATHKDLFLKDPQRYLPQYGGWCAYAMGANAEKVEVDPETFKVRDGKVYLFYNAFFNNTLLTWNKNEGSLRMDADKHWAAFHHSN